MLKKAQNKLRLETVITQAKSLSLMTYGNDGVGFDDMFGEDKDVVLWLLSDLIHEAYGLLTKADDKHVTESIEAINQ